MPNLMPTNNALLHGLSQRAGWAGGEPLANLLMAKALVNPEVISLAVGFVDQQTLPIEATSRAFEEVWSNPETARAALQYGTTRGHLPLREAILQRMLQAEGRGERELHLSVDQIVVTAGSNQFLALVSDVLMDPGDVVICGAPSYYVYLGTLRNLGICPVGVATDQDGLIPAAVEEELSRRQAAGELQRVKAIYVTTYYDNPTGVCLSTPRRAELVEIARRWSGRQPIYVIEDAAYRELRYYGNAEPSLRSFDPDGNTVIYAGTFSKAFSPGIRVGWGILPPALVEPVLATKGNNDFGSPHFNQSLMAAVLRLGLFEPHLEELRAGYRRKIDVMLKAAAEQLQPLGGIDWVRPNGGLYIWLRLPEHLDAGINGPLFDSAIREGVLYIPGDYCYSEPQRAPKNRLRLSFGVPSCENIRRGIEALGRAIGEVL